ncbi:MAG: sigma-70 family RNA polymerase sigma factor [Gemmatimonadota bacterium]
MVKREAEEHTAFTAAFTVVFEQRYPELLRYLDRLTGEPALAADVAQETFVRLYERGEIPDNPRGWLVTVAHNLFRDDRRRSTRRERLLELNAATEPNYQEPNDGAEVGDDHVDGRRVRHALSQLPERERRLLLLRNEGYSYRELAMALQIVESSVGTLLARAKVAFRSAFEGAPGASA